MGGRLLCERWGAARCTEGTRFSGASLSPELSRVLRATFDVLSPAQCWQMPVANVCNGWGLPKVAADSEPSADEEAEAVLACLCTESDIWCLVQSLFISSLFSFNTRACLLTLVHWVRTDSKGGSFPHVGWPTKDNSDASSSSTPAPAAKSRERPSLNWSVRPDATGTFYTLQYY